MHTVIIVIHLMVVLALTGLVLLQKSEGGGLGMGGGGGGGGGFLTSRGTSNVLTRSTAILAAVFFLTSITLSVLASIDRKPRSILTPSGAPAGQNAPLGTGRGVLDQLQPPAPQPPGPPQVPQSQ